MSTSTLGSVNGKNDGRKRICTSFPKKAAGKQPQHAFQVGHRHVVIDEQAFDLVKHGIVSGVGRVGAIDATERNDSHGRPRLFHHANLHRAGLAAQEQRRGGRRTLRSPASRTLSDRLGGRKVKIFERIASRVCG